MFDKNITMKGCEKEKILTNECWMMLHYRTFKSSFLI